MRINDSGAEVMRSAQTRDIQKTNAEGVARQATQPAAPITRSDKVEISDEARRLARGAEGPEAGRGQLSPERIAQYREKILGGAYNSLEVVEQVARKMLTSGDI